MEQQIRERYHDGILQEAMRRYAIADHQIHTIDAFESFIYEFERDAESYILRISHSLRWSEALIQGEIDWINYLAAGGVSAARVIPSETGKLVEAVDDGQGGQFLVTAFVKAQGQPPWALWTPTLYTTYGQLLGSIHALSKHYQPAERAWKRPDWDDERMVFVERFLPAAETVAKEKYQALCAYLHRLPKENAVYGLIHQDAHGSNFLVDENGVITLFDFAECAYSWFINDIAIALFYLVMDAEDAPTFTREFMTHFLRGYRKANPFDLGWLLEIPAFLKLRELELYAVMHRDFDVNNIDNPWCARFMLDRKTRIEQGAPYIDFDFASLSADL